MVSKINLLGTWLLLGLIGIIMIGTGVYIIGSDKETNLLNVNNLIKWRIKNV